MRTVASALTFFMSNSSQVVGNLPFIKFPYHILLFFVRICKIIAVKIHGYAATAPKTALKPFSYEAPDLQPFELLIKVTHSGLCRTDLYMINNDWKRSTYPLLPGHEVVGTIVKKGPLAHGEIGQRVGASWVRASCLTCPLCLQGETNVCPAKTGLYNRGLFGGFADHLVADSRFVYPIPEPLSSAYAAPLLCAGATVYTPLKRYSSTDQSIAVVGMGGLGHLAIKFAHAFGCEVTALSNSLHKKVEAKQFGAHHFFSLDQLPPPSSFDFILVTSDATPDCNALLALLKPNGTLCFVSRPPEGSALDFAYLVSTQKKIVGSNNANRSVMHEMLAFAARHQVVPKIEEMALSQVNEAIQRLKRNQVRYRIVFTV